MLISAREAAQVLAAAGLSREPARRLLLAGFAGEGIRSRGSLLYEEAEVRALLDWPAVEADDTYSATALASGGRYLAGTFVARVGPGRAEASELRNWRGADLTAPLAEQLAAVRMYWQVAPGTRLVLRHRVDRDGFVPFVATVSGFVAVTANIAGLAVDHERGVVLDLDRPGAWSERFRGHRLITRRGGPWTPWTGH